MNDTVKTQKYLLIGTDEAGYGPNLGPLTVSATYWTIPQEDNTELMLQLNQQGIKIVDSKKLYQSGKIAPLERMVQLLVGYLNIKPIDFIENTVQNHSLRDLVLCENGSEEFRKQIETDIARFRYVLEKNEVNLLGLRSRMIDPEEFNRLITQVDSKGTLLSRATLQLVRHAVETQSDLFPDHRILVLCDKHGGRNRYQELLMDFFPEQMVWTIQEKRSESIYRSQWKSRPIEFRFTAKGETQLPVAAASLISKYLREQAMIRFNQFWSEKVPDLKPTAGYPEDAKRFNEEITQAQVEAGIEDHQIWRQK